MGEPTVIHSQVPAKQVTEIGVLSKVYRVEMEEIYTGWFKVSNMRGAPNSTVKFQVSSNAVMNSEYGMADTFTFGPSGQGEFSMRFSYHEVLYITVSGLSHQLNVD